MGPPRFRCATPNPKELDVKMAVQFYIIVKPLHVLLIPWLVCCHRLHLRNVVQLYITSDSLVHTREVWI